ncbi:MAG: hypothetical protein R3174_15345 [Gammaproteobacteria bacterium]|nr:hypothetical protein [Gammaproteobacteria bacterium]
MPLSTHAEFSQLNHKNFADAFLVASSTGNPMQTPDAATPAPNAADVDESFARNDAAGSERGMEDLPRRGGSLR